MQKLSAKILVSFFIIFSSFSYAAIPNVGSDGKPFPSLSPMLKKINPAVVNIATYSTRKQNSNPLLNDPFFRRFFNIPDQPRQPQKKQKKQHSAGSGVIVDAGDGIVMTNFHVINNAEEILVSLVDGRSFKAELVGSDPELDIAILQVDADDLIEVKIADSSRLEVGDFVVAIGNPFGLGQTVTTGIVSALGRSGLGIEGYENFIQTDASINPGNSGGALVNLAGELIGINTAIIAPSGGNVGIGFAIPTNMAKASMQQIVEHGEVRRGQIGVGIQDITPALREAFDLENGQLGVLVTDVVKGSPAGKAGLQSGDIIIQVDDKASASTGQLRSRISIKKVGEKVKLTLLRDGDEKQLSVKVGEPQLAAEQGKLHPLLEGGTFDNDPDGNGVVVTQLAANSIAAYSGLRPGDLVIAANRHRVYDLASLSKVLDKSNNSILLQISRSGRSLFVVIQ